MSDRSSCIQPSPGLLPCSCPWCHTVCVSWTTQQLFTKLIPTVHVNKAFSAVEKQEAKLRKY